MKKINLLIFTFISLFIFMGNVLAESFYFEGDSLKVKFTSNYGNSKGKEVVATYTYNKNYGDGPAFQLLDSNPHYMEYFYSSDKTNIIILVSSLSAKTGLSSNQIPSAYGGTKKTSEEEKKKEEEQKQKDYNIQYFQNGSTVTVTYHDYNADQDIQVTYKMCTDSKTGDITYSLHPYMNEDDGCKINDIHTYISKEADNAAKAGAMDSFNCKNAPAKVSIECNSISDPVEKKDDGTIDLVDDGCGGVFGDPEDPNYIAYYLQLIFNIIKFLGPVLVIVMSIIDLLKVTAEQKQDGELEKLGGKTLKRLIYAVIIFVLPSLINYIFGLIGLYGTCGIS